MKTNLLKGLTTLAIATMVIVGCQKESMVQSDNHSSNTSNSSASVSAGDYFSYSNATETEDGITACVGDKVTVFFDIGQNVSCGTARIDYRAPGEDWTQEWFEAEPENGVVSTEIEITVEGTYRFRGTYSRVALGGGKFCGTNISGFVHATDLTGVICCSNALTSELDCSGENKILTVTFTALEDGPIVIQGGLSSGAVIEDASSNVLNRNTTHNATGGPSNVTRWEGNVTACEKVTITIEYSGGNGIGSWSAKRGEEVLGSTEAQSCN